MPPVKWMKPINARNPSQIIEGSNSNQWTPFHRDFAQIVHSDFFKRLAGKTQVHSFPINDHLRTRMTHSVEASQLGRHIARYFSFRLAKFANFEPEESFSFTSSLEELTAAACLLHDVGHPPFGHVGAGLLDELANKFSEEFNDNKQVERVVLNNLWNEKFDPSGPLAAAVMKKFNPSESAYKTEVALLEKNLAELELTNFRHPASLFMEAADDIAYLAADLSDYLRYFIDSSQFEDLCGTQVIRKLSEIRKVDKSFEFSETDNLYKLMLATFSPERSDEAIFEFTSNLIKSCLKVIFSNIDIFFKEASLSLEPNQAPNALKEFIQKYSCNNDVNLLYLTCSKEGPIFFDLKKKAYKSHILEQPYIGSQNLLAKKVLSELFFQFEDLIHTEFRSSDIFKMLPLDCKGYILSAHDVTSQSRPARVVLDFISGMTDEYALKTWEMITRPHVLSRSA